jgi:hypothetical protein
MGLMRFNYVRSMTFQSTSKFSPDSRWAFGSLFFIVDKFGDLSLQDPEPWEIIRSGTNCLPPILARVGLITEAQLGHRFNAMGEAKSDPSGDKADHHRIACPVTANPIYQSPTESDFNGGREVYMVWQGEPSG